jgi:glutamine synthetase
MFHEKPFAGVNGSGKHNNWSMMITASGAELDGENLLEPGKTPHENLRFLLVLSAVLRGVHKHAGLLRAGIASSGNDHRLGANEAPPAIISVFLGDLLTRILNELETGTGTQSAEAAVLKLGVSRLPEVMKDNTDRNRTSPFAFTGNKFEFRAVGSSASTAFPITLVNAAVADGLSEITESLKSKLKSAKGMDDAILAVIRDAIKETKAIRFEGNNYSEDWVKEAAKRGLPNLRKTPEALHELVTEKSKQALTSLGIFTEAELNSRFHVRIERFVKNLMIEADTLKSIVDTMILPACYAYHGVLAGAVAAAKAAGVTAPQSETLQKLGTLIGTLSSKRSAFESAVHKAESAGSEEAKAKAFSTDVSTSMAEVRAVCDELESMVADDYWPMPKYREMLFLA